MHKITFMQRENREKNSSVTETSYERSAATTVASAKPMDPMLCTAPLFATGGGVEGGLALNAVACPLGFWLVRVDVVPAGLAVVALGEVVVVGVVVFVAVVLIGVPAPAAPAALPPGTHPSHEFIWSLGTGFRIH